MADHLFVHFRIVGRDATTALPRQQCWSDTAEKVTGVASALMCRLETRDGQATWTELYDDVSPVFVTTLATLWETNGPREFVAGERHIELFVSLENS